MKKIVLIILIFILLFIFWWLLRPGFSDITEATFTGTLHDASGQPVIGADVSVGDNSTVTDEEGKFIIKGSWVSQERWLLEVRRPGYAPISKVFSQGTQEVNLTTVTLTTKAFDAGLAIVARDIRTNCIGSIDSGVDWGVHPLARFPQVIDSSGNRVTDQLPPTARKMLQFLSDSQPCSSGFQVSIPANSLMGSSNQPSQGQVEVGLSTIDLYSPDGMLGDYTVAFDDGPAYMESFGAGTIEIRSGDDILQLKKGAKAEIMIPVDQAQIDAGSKIPPTIPLLKYERKTGQWRNIGEAILDAEQMVYIGEVSHFSEFNADVVKTNPACLRFDASGITSNFDLVITAPTSSGGFKQVTKLIQSNSTQLNPNLHAIYNLPANQWVVLRVIKSGVPVGTWVVQTGAAWGSTAAPTYDYAACGTIFNLSEAIGTGVTHNGSGSAHRFGLLPKHVSFMVNTSGATEDVYPVGGTNCNSPCLYLFSLFDTGSNVVLIDSVLTTTHGITLTPNPLWDVDVRIDGLDKLGSGTNPGAPFGLPGSSGGAEAHTGVLRVAPRSLTRTEEETQTNSAGTPVGGFVNVNYMLAGAPVTNKVVARIDYTTTKTKGPWTFGVAPFTITAPDIEFYQPGTAGIPTPTLTLFLEGFGVASAATTGTKDQRHFLQNVTFTKGVNTVYDAQTLMNPVRFMFDTATTFTVISQAMATSLGANPTSPSMTAGCSSNDTANFVQIDSIKVVGMNSSSQLATYQINNAEVCVDVADTVIMSTSSYLDPVTGLPRKVDAVIGSNLFDQAKVLWNGPNRTLGILP